MLLCLSPWDVPEAREDQRALATKVDVNAAPSLAADTAVDSDEHRDTLRIYKAAYRGVPIRDLHRCHCAHHIALEVEVEEAVRSVHGSHHSRGQAASLASYCTVNQGCKKGVAQRLRPRGNFVV